MQPTHISPVDTLYYSPGAASMLVHWLLLELEVPHVLHRVDTAAGEHKRPEYLALNPNGVVPTWISNGSRKYWRNWNISKAMPKSGAMR